MGQKATQLHQDNTYCGTCWRRKWREPSKGWR